MAPQSTLKGTLREQQGSKPDRCDIRLTTRPASSCIHTPTIGNMDMLWSHSIFQKGAGYYTLSKASCRDKPLSSIKWDNDGLFHLLEFHLRYVHIFLSLLFYRIGSVGFCSWGISTTKSEIIDSTCIRRCVFKYHCSQSMQQRFPETKILAIFAQQRCTSMLNLYLREFSRLRNKTALVPL